MGIVDKLIIKATNFSRENFSWHWIILLIILVRLISYLLFRKKSTKTPFSTESVKDRRPVVLDAAKKDAVLKQGFTSKKVPTDSDVIVIGSGIGGLSCAAILSKAGKKVLVLEQHDQAGGCCHTFVEDGYEFDVGIHYVGEVTGNTLTQTFLDQITEGQLGWFPVDDVIDSVELGTDENRTTHKVVKGRDAWKNELKNSFPDEHIAIDKFFSEMRAAREVFGHSFVLKMLPLWIVKILLKTGLFSLFSSLPKYCQKSIGSFMDEITSNERLKAAICYSFGDYGTQPRESPMLMHMLLMSHYVSFGGYYPIGGASEIAHTIIPVIEKSGGRVLVRANVTKILMDANGNANGVAVSKGGEEINVFAPIIVSAAGIINTYMKLLPQSLVKQLKLEGGLLKNVRSGWGAMSVFVGLNASNEELNLKATNTWAFCEVNLDKGFDEYIALPREEVGTKDIPLLFISFPSTKDPTWNERYPGKSNCTIVTLANWEWFSQWETDRVKKRGGDYNDLKNRIGEKVWEQTCKYYPQIKDKRDYFDVGTPLTNTYYIGASNGEIYGLDHSLDRFKPEVMAELRPTTAVPGLYLTGQDISTCGFAGALYSGLLTASTLLGRNLMNDLMQVQKEIIFEARSKSKSN